MKVPGAVVLAIGQAGLGRRSLLAAAAAEADLHLLEIDATRLAKDPDELARQLRLIARECKLLAKVPLVRHLDALVMDRDASRVDLVGSELASELSTAVLATCGAHRPQLQWRRPVITIEMKTPTTAQCAELWSQALTAAGDRFTGVDARQLATLFPIAPALVGPVVAAARIHACDRIDAGIRSGLRAILDNRVGHVARRLDGTQTWKDLVIDRDQQNALVELVARIRERSTVYEQWGFADKVGRGLGVAALFSGPPGTGKTMVAGLIAHELGLELYQVDLSKLVSKYIGETEKQLGELFDAAEAGHAVLLFDEADALFGKRTEVRSSNDRYANLETNYLLQRLESFTGICLLTSNHETHIDPAFQRRLALHMRFEMPDEKMRASLWQAMLPTAAPVESGINFADLARRYEMSGGYIRNAALRAAFLAADAQQPIGNDLLLYTAQLEYEGMGRVV